MANAKIRSLQEQTSSWDKDERYMATSDLCVELQKDVSMDRQMEELVCSAVLKRLRDPSNDVQSIAVKCLGVLVKKVGLTQVKEIAEKLCDLVLEGKTELLDIYSIGLKTLVADVPDTVGASIARPLAVKLLPGIQQDNSVEVKLECLDNMADVFKRFGTPVEPDHEMIMLTILNQLHRNKPVVRKHATACLGYLAVAISDELLHSLVSKLLQHIESEAPKSASEPQRPDVVRTLIQCIGTIGRMVGYRLGKHLYAIVPLFLRFCGNVDDEALHTEASDELRETCFRALESFVLHCPREVTQHLPDILNVSLSFLKYDPNYVYGEERDEEYDSDMMDSEDGFSDDGFGDVSDDNGSSWKVRRSAVKVIMAIIKCRPELLEELYWKCAEVLISCFKEREENIRVDIIHAFSELLAATVETPSLSVGERTTNGPRPAARQKHAVELLRCRLPAIMKATNKQLKNCPRITVAALHVLRNLCLVLEGGLDGYMGSLLASFHLCLTDKKKQAPKLEVLSFLLLAIQTHPPEVLYPHLPTIIEDVMTCVSEDWYKIITEALRCVGGIIRIVRPISQDRTSFVECFNYAPYVKQLYAEILPRLKAYDIDQTIKECAIESMGLLVAHMGDHLHDELPTVLHLLMERLHNEIIRKSTMQSLSLICLSPLHLDLSPILSDATKELATFLRQQQRQLKELTLETLAAFVASHSSQITVEVFSLLVKDASALVHASDLHLGYLAMHLIKEILVCAPSIAPVVEQETIPRTLQLVASPLLQGQAIESLISLYQALADIGFQGLTAEDLILKLRELVVTGLVPAGGQKSMKQVQVIPRQAMGNIAHCMAVLYTRIGGGAGKDKVTALVQEIKGADDTAKHLALLVLGDIGRQIDLSWIVDLQPLIQEIFETGSEECKTAAAYALGKVTVGKMATFLVTILDALNESKHQYLILSALKEVIVCHHQQKDGNFDIGPYVSQILPHLLKYCESPEEGVRNMVADCFGSLIVQKPSSLCDILLRTSQGASSAKWTMATALKYAVSSGVPLPEVGYMLPQFLGTLFEDEDLDVRRAALLMVTTTVHHQPDLVADHVPAIVTPVLLSTMVLKRERVVDLGPFKHRVDDGEPLRKAALACISTILETIPGRIDMGELMPPLCKGLADSKPEVQMLCHGVLIQVCHINPGAVLSNLTAILRPVSAVCCGNVKHGQVGAEIDRANELIRSATRVVFELGKLDEVKASHPYSETMEKLMKSSPHASNMLSSMQNGDTTLLKALHPQF